ncbi:hypothetical protein AGMMS50293_17440 [Spirochaetia bacterium]|nr:hypothetical protein AGMMS50293_17440 [Spirochaetia bacterium]
MAYGGFPGLHEMQKDENLIRSFLNGIYNTILMKDVVEQNTVRDTDLLEKVARFAAGNIGNIISAKKLSDYLTSGGRKTSHETIDAYLDSLEKAFFLYRAPRYDIKGKALMKTLGKYYIVDAGLRYWSLGKKGVDIGSVLENIVYLELIRRGYQVFVGKLPKPQKGNEDHEIDCLRRVHTQEPATRGSLWGVKKGMYPETNTLPKQPYPVRSASPAQRVLGLVDFIAMKDGITSYYQVTQFLQGKKVLDRELAPLKTIDDNYEKIILSLDRTPFTDYEGIQQRNIVEWLME